MPGPLDGYRIVDLTSMISGPLATMILADQGADVIKVENPDGGDHTRAANNRRNGFSASFLNNNRNKRSVALDLKHPAALQALLRLVATADVFVQNFRPGVAERMGLGRSRGAVGGAADRLRLDQRLWRNRTVCSEAGLRPADPGGLRLGQHPGRLGYRAATPGADHLAGQADRSLRGSGDHRGAAGAGAARGNARAGAACPPVDAGCGDRIPLGLRHGQPDIRRRSNPAAGSGQLHRPDLRNRHRPDQRRGTDQSRMARPDPSIEQA